MLRIVDADNWTPTARRWCVEARNCSRPPASSTCQIRALYRNLELKAMRQEARQKWLAEWGSSLGRRLHRRPTARRKGCKAGNAWGCPGSFAGCYESPELSQG